MNHPGPTNEPLVRWAQLMLILILPASRICKQGFDGVLLRQYRAVLQMSLCTCNTDVESIRSVHGTLFFLAQLLV